MNAEDKITWVSANTVVEGITRNMAREFRSSNPRPRNHVMGFNGSDKKQTRDQHNLRRLK